MSLKQQLVVVYLGKWIPFEFRVVWGFFFHNGSKKSPQTNEEQIPLTAKAKGGIDKWVIWPQNEVN